MTNAILWLRRQLGFGRPPPSTTPSSARAQLHRIEHKIDRLGWHMTRSLLMSPTSTPTMAPSISTATTAASPTTAPAATRAPSTSTSPPPIIKHGRRLLPKLLGWAAERLIGYLLPSLISLGLAAWALVRRYGEEMWVYVSGWWHWVLG